MLAQPNIDGIYVDKHNELHMIELSNGRFRFIKQFYRPTFAEEYIYKKQLIKKPEEYIYAEANYEWIDDEFIEFHSENPVIDSLLEIKRIKNDTIKGKIHDRKIKVIIPDVHRRELNVTMFYNVMQLKMLWFNFYYVSTDKWKQGDTKQVSGCQAEFSLPARITKIYLRIEPKNIYHGLGEWDHDICYDSYLDYETPVITLYDDYYVEITINGIDDTYFGRYDINGEYAKVTRDKIVWREHIFEKIPD